MNANRKSLFLAYVLFALSTISANAQSEADTYNSYDNKAGLENLNLNNGRAYPNPYLIRKGNDQFFKTDQYTDGTVYYDGQPYYNASIRYDIYHDILVFRPKNSDNNIGTVLEKQFVSGFVLDGRNFVNLDNLQNKPANVNGYYEKCASEKGYTLYAKHHKFIRERHDGSVTIHEFSEDPSFFLEKDGTFTKVKTKGDFTAIFPDQKERIKDFYQSQKELSKKDPSQFMTRLFRHISNVQN